MVGPSKTLDIGRMEAFAPAKINLCLHVVGRRADGYHELESLVSFLPEVGDRLALTASETSADELEITGPFATGLPCDDTNSVLKALRLVRDQVGRFGYAVPPVRIDLFKDLPVASGIGGGSSDAAALLRLFIKRIPAAAAALRARSIDLGADVPMCLEGRPSLISGIGERVTPLATSLPDLPLLLVNPDIPVSTPVVFKALANPANSPLAPVPSAGFDSVRALANWLSASRNDLEPAAEVLVPEIGRVRENLERCGASVARMSGSGATVFGLFDSASERDTARETIASRHPEWWVSGRSAAACSYVRAKAKPQQRASAR